MDFKKEVVFLISKWQRILKLQHWHINVKVCDPGIGDTSNADVDADATYLVADIRVFRRAEGSKELTEEQLNNTIIHELLHLHTAGLGVVIGTPQHVAEEQAIQILSRVIWEGYCDRSK
jgi:hypothetical protein